MAYDKYLADSLRNHLTKYGSSIQEKKMFGGLCFLYKGKMAVGVVKNELAVRVLSEKIQNELDKDHVRPMDFTGKPMKEFVFVELQDEAEVTHWIDLGIAHAESKLKV